MSKKERTPAKTDNPGPGDEQVIINLMEQRRLQQGALKKIITSMDKANDDIDSKDPKPKTKLN